MAIQSFSPAGGIWHDGTGYAAKNKWYNGDKIRFKEGFPQKIGGWTQSVSGATLGTCRALWQWQDLSLNKQLGIGTDLKYYVSTNGAAPQDITPIRQVDNLGANPFSVTMGSSIVTVSDGSNGAIKNDFVTFSGASGFTGGISPAVLNSQFQIVSIIDANTYTFDCGVLASSTTTGGGGAVVATYQINTGSTVSINGGGWGSGTWSRGGWGSQYNITTPGSQLRIWSNSNFGQDLVINPRGGGIYYWAANSGRAVDIATLPGASNTPVAANLILVSNADQRVFAFGVNPIGSTVIDPLFIRWSSDGSASNWDPTISDSSGALRLSSGSQILAAELAQGQIVVWTDSSLHSVQFIGGDLTYGTQLLDPNVDLIGPNATISVGSFAMWMGRQNFYIYDGSAITVPCPVRQYVFSNINLGQASKVICGSNRLHREVWFFYPSASSSENDSYVVFNYADQTWYFGSMARTAWCDCGIQNYPQAANPADGYIYFQDYGNDDGTTNPPSPITAFLESGPMEIQDGDSFLYMQKIIPDVTFIGSSAISPILTYTVAAKDYPGGPYYPGDTDPAQSVSVPMGQFTTKIDTRIRGRQYTLRVQSDSMVGVAWRLGTQRFDVQPDGRR